MSRKRNKRIGVGGGKVREKKTNKKNPEDGKVKKKMKR